MDIKEVEKIKGLVNTSPILSSQERAEWLALLDVMNDKQLGELEGILGSENRKPASDRLSSRDGSEVGSLSANRSPLPNPPPKGEGIKQPPASLAKPKDDLRQMPKLSHIMNLPNFGQAGHQAPANLPQVKPPSAFASKLKSIFQEKELPAGHEELELPDGEENRNQKIENRNKETGNKETDEIRGREIQTAAPKPLFPVKEKPPVMPPVKPAFPELKVPLPPKPKVIFPPVFKQPAAPPKSSSIISQPINLSAKDKEPLSKKQPASKPLVQKSSPLEQPAINTLQDLALFENRALQILSLDDLVKRIKQLIAKYGYFEVIFNLEKSRAYKNYISTGLELLSGQSNFVSLGARQEGDYLSKEQFEKFVDLLSKIQTG